jgi:hypothetical protein
MKMKKMMMMKLIGSKNPLSISKRGLAFSVLTEN